MENIRNSVDKREIIKYLKLRERSLHMTIVEGKKPEREIKILKIRHGENGRLLALISKDTIRKEIKKLHKHFHLNAKFKLEKKLEVKK
jgi:hypothetical protein